MYVVCVLYVVDMYYKLFNLISYLHTIYKLNIIHSQSNSKSRF